MKLKNQSYNLFFSILILCPLLLFNLAPFANALEKESFDLNFGKGKGGTLSFKLKDADIKSVLQIFAKQLGKNIVAGEGVKGTISLAFSNVKPQEGLEAVLRAKGLDWFQQGDTIVVSNQKMVRTYLLQYASALEIKSALELLMTQGDQVSVNDSYNALIVKTSSDNIGRIEKAIRDMDVPPLQVMVECKVIELKITDGGKKGLDVKYSYSRNPNDTAQTKGFAEKPESTTSPLGFYSQIISGNTEAYLSALLSRTNYDLIASPRIATLNHKAASILIGAKLGYKTAIITTTGTVQQINFLETGTKLVITPHVSDDGFIRMAIAPKISEGYVADDLPTENTTETSNEVMVKSGQTIVIGGLTKKKETLTEYGIPFLMNIPYIGNFFKKTIIDNEKRELMVVLTPTIMTPEYLNNMRTEIDGMLDKEKSRTSEIIN